MALSVSTASRAVRQTGSEPIALAEEPPSGSRPDRRQANATQHEDDLLQAFAATRSPDLREELVRRFMPLARSLALRYRRRTESLDDLLQVANLGLVKWINGFDPSRGFPFEAYAVPTILGELRRHFRDHVWNLRLPRGMQELTMQIDRAADGLAEELGRHPTPTEIAQRLDVTVENVLEGIEAGHARGTQSLDAPSTQDEGSVTLVETLGGTEAGYDRVEAADAAGRAELDDREWQVLRMRFVDQMTQREIGHELGVSQMAISRISRRGLGKLLTAVRGEQADGSTKVAA
jgi:RNA polymerase sigma-B factor